MTLFGLFLDNQWKFPLGIWRKKIETASVKYIISLFLHLNKGGIMRTLWDYDKNLVFAVGGYIKYFPSESNWL